MEHHDNSAAIVKHLVDNHQFKQRGDVLVQGICPVCQKKEAWAKVARPHYIYCNRKNKCGEATKTFDKFPFLYQSITERYEKKLESDHKAIARAYLTEKRGFDVAQLKGMYEQSWINNPNGINPKGRSGVFAVRFPIAHNVFFERYVETIKVRDEDGHLQSRNNRIVGKYLGLAYEPNTQSIKSGDTVYITEAVIKTLALVLNGHKSVSSLSAGHFPHTFFAQNKGKNINWVFAFDNDKAGKDYTKKHIERLKEIGEQATCIFPYQGYDWDELHKQGKLTVTDFENFYHLGKIYLAESAEEKGNLMFSKSGSRFFVFDYDNQMYAFDMNDTKGKAYEEAIIEIEEKEPELSDQEIKDKALKRSRMVDNIANCKVKLLYSQMNQVTDELHYFFQVKHPQGLTELNTMTGNQIDTNSDFRKRLKSMAAGALWFGDNNHLTWLIKGWMQNLNRVQTQMYSGYNKEVGAYIYNDVAVKDGKIYHKNQHDFFKIDKTCIKGIGHSVKVKTNADLSAYNDAWFDYMYRSFGTKSIVALTFWLGSLFAEQIRAQHKSYPFLEMIGEGGSGKSTLLEFLWKLIGREDYEGFNPSKSTHANVARNFDSLSNSPVALIEADHEDDAIKGSHRARWNWDDLKDSWNGRPIRGRGVKTAGNEVLEQPFKGAIVIVQNPPVNAERPILQRIMHLEFDQSTHTDDSFAAAQLLEQFPAEKCSGWLLKCITKEAEILTIFNKNVIKYTNQLLSHNEIREVRIAKNHAQLRALLDTLKLVAPISDGQFNDARQMILEMAIERQKACSEDHPIIEEFWDHVDYLESIGKNNKLSAVNMSDDYEQLEDFEKIRNDDKEMTMINQHTKEGMIAINLPHFERTAKEYRLDIPPISILKKYLKNSKNPKFLAANKAVHSSLTHKPVKCWIFATKKRAA